MVFFLFFFFFQAEDGIRDLTVTGVQTCALPISLRGDSAGAREPAERRAGEAGEDPLAPELRAELSVEADRGRVPVEHTLLPVKSTTSRLLVFPWSAEERLVS